MFSAKITPTQNNERHVSKHKQSAWVRRSSSHSIILLLFSSVCRTFASRFCVVWLKDLVSEVSLTKKVHASSWPEWITFSVWLLQIRLPILLVMSTEWGLPRSGRPWKCIPLRQRQSNILDFCTHRTGKGKRRTGSPPWSGSIQLA